MIDAATLARYRARLARVRRRCDVEDVPWLVARVGELLAEVEALGRGWPRQAGMWEGTDPTHQEEV